MSDLCDEENNGQWKKTERSIRIRLSMWQALAIIQVDGWDVVKCNVNITGSVIGSLPNHFL